MAPHEEPGGRHRGTGGESEGGQSPRASAATFRKGGAFGASLGAIYGQTYAPPKGCELVMLQCVSTRRLTYDWVVDLHPAL